MIHNTSNVTKNEFTYFPSQKKADKAKTIDWMVACIEAAEHMALYRDEKLRQRQREKQINYNLYNDILDQKDVQRICDPFNLGVQEMPAKMQNYPLANKKIDLLVGEEMKRRFEWRVRVLNSDAITQKEETLKEELRRLIVSSIKGNDPEKVIEEKLRKFEKFKNYEFQDLRERDASHVLKYLWYKQDLKTKFSAGMFDVLLAAEETYSAEILGGEPVARKINPNNLYTIRSGDSPYIEDSDIIIEDGYRSVGQVIDDYYDVLTPKEVELIEGGYDNNRSGSKILNYNTDFPILTTDAVVTSEDMPFEMINPGQMRAFGGAYDEYGNVRVTRVLWKSMRKLKKLTYFDEFGDFQEEVKDEHYVADLTKGEIVKELWVSEWWEGTRIAKDIYVKMGPRPVQFREMENLSKCKPGIVGTIYTLNDSKAKSLMDLMKSYQYLYNVFMYRTELAFAKAYGKIGKIDLSRIPDGWDIKTWMHYAINMGFAIEDPFTEGKKGVATGKLAGNMSPSSPVIDMEMGNYIQQHISMLQFLEVQMGKISGVSDQREGAISSSELVGNVERAVTQSSHITEKYFQIHDNTKKRFMSILLDTAKIAWKKKSKKLQYIADDFSTVITDIDGELFASSEYGLFISDSGKDSELFNNLSALAHAAMQNDKMNFSTLMDIYYTDSMVDMRRKIEQGELEAQERQSQAQEQESQMRQAEMENLNNLAERKENLEIRLKEMDKEKAIEVENIRAANNYAYNRLTTPTNEGDLDKDRNGIKDELDLERLRQQSLEFDRLYKLKQEELQEKIRQNKAKEEIEKSKVAAIKRKQQ